MGRNSDQGVVAYELLYKNCKSGKGNSECPQEAKDRRVGQAEELARRQLDSSSEDMKDYPYNR